jgi:ATP/maltotriose-dependent transcriptional regulator MalT
MLEGLQRGEAALTRRTAARLLRGFATLSQEGSGQREALTEREVALLQLVASGLSNRAVAAQLSISENTVKYHMRNILQKLGVQNRTEAVACALRLGLIEQEPRR